MSGIVSADAVPAMADCTAIHRGSAEASMPSSLADLWAGRLPLPKAFWHWMVFWGFLINLGATMASLAVLVVAGGGAPQAWAAALSVAIHLLPVPYNLACLIGVWRSAGRPEVKPTPRLLTRSAALLWTGAMLLI